MITNLRKIFSYFKFKYYKYKKRDFLKNSKYFSQEGEDIFLVDYFKDKNSGFYNLIEYTAPADLVSSIELDFTRDETVMRYLTVTLDKHAVAWAEKRRNRSTKKVSTKKAS